MRSPDVKSVNDKTLPAVGVLTPDQLAYAVPPPWFISLTEVKYGIPTGPDELPA
jgi:hypothetical protein